MRPWVVLTVSPVDLWVTTHICYAEHPLDAMHAILRANPGAVLHDTIRESPVAGLQTNATWVGDRP